MLKRWLIGCVTMLLLLIVKEIELDPLTSFFEHVFVGTYCPISFHPTFYCIYIFSSLFFVTNDIKLWLQWWEDQFNWPFYFVLDAVKWNADMMQPLSHRRPRIELLRCFEWGLTFLITGSLSVYGQTGMVLVCAGVLVCQLVRTMVPMRWQFFSAFGQMAKT